MILEGLFGNSTAPKVLLYLQARGEGYPSALAQAFGVPVNQTQRQLERFELEGVLSSRLAGRTRIYTFNPRCFYIADLRSMLAKALARLPLDLREELLKQRKRPRRKGKKLPG